MTEITEIIRQILKTPGGYHETGKYRRGLKKAPDAYLLIGDTNIICNSIGILPKRTFYVDNLTFYVAQPWFMGAAWLKSTGPEPFMQWVCGLARKKGMRLKYDGLWHCGNVVHARSEEGIFQALGLPYIKPENRNVKGDWSTWKIPELKSLRHW